MKIVTFIPLFFAMLLLYGSTAWPVHAQPAAADTEDVIWGIVNALNEGDVERALTLVADQATIMLMPPPPTGAVYSGKEEIGIWWEALVANHSAITVSNLQSTGAMATWSATVADDDFRALGIDSLSFDGVGIVRSGKLQSYTWVMTEESQARFQSAAQLAANEQLTTRYMEEIWNQGDLSVADEIIAEDFVSHNFPAGDRTALKESVVGFRAENPNAYFPYDDMTVTEDRVYIVNQVMVHPEGAAADAEGEAASEPMVLILGIANGQITDRWLFMYAPAEIPISVE